MQSSLRHVFYVIIILSCGGSFHPSIRSSVGLLIVWRWSKKGPHMLYAVACSTAIVIEFLLLLLLIQDDSFYVFFIISLLLLFSLSHRFIIKRETLQTRRDETLALSLTRSLGGSGDGNLFSFFQHRA